MCLIVAIYVLEHVFCVVADVFRERLQLHDTGLSWKAMKMVSRRWIDNKTRARVYYLSQVKGMSIRKTALHCNVSRGVVWRIIQRQREKESNRWKSKTSTLHRGRPRKLTGRQGRLLLRC